MAEIEIPPDPFDVAPPLQGGSRSDAPGVSGSNRGRGPGVFGSAHDGNGVVGVGTNNGVAGQCSTPNHSGVWGNHTGLGFGVTGDSHASGGAGVLGRGFDGALAGRFEGVVEVTDDIRLLNPAGDCAEDVDVDEQELTESGTVKVLCEKGACTKARNLMIGVSRALSLGWRL
jgi:hypothetical protein